MKLPGYLLQSSLAGLPLQYDWTRIIANSFRISTSTRMAGSITAERFALVVLFSHSQLRSVFDAKT